MVEWGHRLTDLVVTGTKKRNLALGGVEDVHWFYKHARCPKLLLKGNAPQMGIEIQIHQEKEGDNALINLADFHPVA